MMKKSPRGVLLQRTLTREKKKEQTSTSPSNATVPEPEDDDLEWGDEKPRGLPLVAASDSTASGEQTNSTASGQLEEQAALEIQKVVRGRQVRSPNHLSPLLAYDPQQASSPRSTASGEKGKMRGPPLQRALSPLSTVSGENSRQISSGEKGTTRRPPLQRPKKKERMSTSTSRRPSNAAAPAPDGGDQEHAGKATKETLTLTKETLTQTKEIFTQAKESKRIKITRLLDDHDLGTLLAAEGMEEIEEAFVNEDIFSVEAAASLDPEELRKILEGHGIVASVGLLRRLVTIFQEGLCNSRLENIVPTGNSVLSRSMLQLQPENLKAGLVERFNAETIFATLMFAVAGTMLTTVPLAETCLKEFSQHHCDQLRCSYMVCWGLASAFFSNATLVTMGSVGLFFGHASFSTIHRRFISAERYMAISHVYISFGILFGLLPGSCVNIVLRFPEFPRFFVAVSVVHWLMWIHQFIQGGLAVKEVYSDFPGYVNVWQMIRGYIDVRGKSLRHSLKAAGMRSRTSCTHNMDV